MKSKAPLLLMEQMVMLLVFALAAALCLQAFVKSDEISRRSEARDRALAEAQTVAETVRHCRGDMAQAAALLGASYSHGSGENALMADYDRDWNLAQDSMRYTLGVCRLDSDIPGLGRAQVWVRDEAAEEELVRMDIAWQEEVDSNGR